VNGTCVEVKLQSVDVVCPITSFRNASGGCTECSTGIANCFECVNSTICSLCNDGFTLNATKTACEPACAQNEFRDPADNQCKRCINNCDLCDNTSTCIKCRTGFLLSADKSVCAICDTEFGNFLNSMGKCKTCEPKCKKCISETVCETCKAGHTLKSFGI
jgi:hypothetical protein